MWKEDEGGEEEEESKMGLAVSRDARIIVAP